MIWGTIRCGVSIKLPKDAKPLLIRAPAETAYPGLAARGWMSGKVASRVFGRALAIRSTKGIFARPFSSAVYS